MVAQEQQWSTINWWRKNRTMSFQLVAQEQKRWAFKLVAQEQKDELLKWWRKNKEYGFSNWWHKNRRVNSQLRAQQEDMSIQKKSF